MNVLCAACGKALQVPPDKAAIPNLKARCQCGHVFLVAEAPRAPEAGAPAPTRPQTGAMPRAASAPPPAAAAPVRPQPTAAASAPTTSAGPARPATGAMPRVTPAGAAAATAAGTATPPATGRVATAPPSWRRCLNHAERLSMHVCPKCAKGYCGQCAQVVQGGAICPDCDQLCVPSQKYEEHQRLQRERARPLLADLGLIFAYPLRDRLGFVLLVVFTYVFSFVFSLLSTGVMLWYTFHALSKVAIGNQRDFAPDFTDIDDIARPARLSLAALIISLGPLFAVLYFAPPTPVHEYLTRSAPAQVEQAHAAPVAEDVPVDEGDGDAPVAEGDDAGAPVSAPEAEAPTVEDAGRLLVSLGLVLLTALWAVFYAPAALVVAALSRSFVSTLNPLVGLDTIRRMGLTYAQAWLIYLGILIAKSLVGLPLGFIPIAGGVALAFVNAYASLAIACTLGLAVFKKAPELGWD